VVEILEGGSLDARTIKHVIGLAVRVEVGRSDQGIAAYNARPECASDERGAGQIPDSRLTGAGIEKQIIGFVIAIEVRHADHSPTSRKSGSVGAGDKGIVVQVPDRRLARACRHRCFYLQREVLVRSISPPPYVLARYYP